MFEDFINRSDNEKQEPDPDEIDDQSDSQTVSSKEDVVDDQNENGHLLKNTGNVKKRSKDHHSLDTDDEQIESTPNSAHSLNQHLEKIDTLPFPKSVLPWKDETNDLTRQLLKSGYTSIKIISTATVGEITSLTHLSEHQAKRLINNAKDWQDFNFETAANLLEDRNQLHRISTSSKSLDLLLGGGIEPRSITEFYGSFTTGKTQLSIQLAVNVALPPSHGGLDGYVVYIDTEGSFRPERVVQICNHLNYDAEKVLHRILVGRAHNSTIQMELTNTILELGSKKPIKLVIVDSLTSNFRAEFIGKDSIMERQQKMNQHVQQLSRIADMLNVAIVITNQVMSVINGYENEIQPVGGNILAHGSTHRIELSKSPTHPQIRLAKLVASPSLPESRGNYRITEAGIKDTVETNVD